MRISTESYLLIQLIEIIQKTSEGNVKETKSYETKVDNTYKSIMAYKICTILKFIFLSSHIAAKTISIQQSQTPSILYVQAIRLDCDQQN